MKLTAARREAAVICCAAQGGEGAIYWVGTRSETPIFSPPALLFLPVIGPLGTPHPLAALPPCLFCPREQEKNAVEAAKFELQQRHKSRKTPVNAKWHTFRQLEHATAIHNTPPPPKKTISGAVLQWVNNKRACTPENKRRSWYINVTDG